MKKKVMGADFSLICICDKCKHDVINAVFLCYSTSLFFQKVVFCFHDLLSVIVTHKQFFNYSFFMNNIASSTIQVLAFLHLIPMNFE